MAAPLGCQSVPRYLTLTELVLNSLVYGAVGWWLGGRWGLGIGLGVLAVLYGWAISRALPPEGKGERSDGP